MDVKQLQIVSYPDPVLRTRAKPVEQITDEVRAVAAQMLHLMHQAPGCGLAAPQVGLPWRLFVVNATGQPGDDQVFVNPVLSRPGREMEDYEEGCLSIPAVTGKIRRPKSITVTASDLEGQSFSITSDQLPARIWQHEYDHLEGVLIIDRMSPIDRLANEKILRELERSR